MYTSSFSITSVMVTVQNSFGSNMYTNAQSFRTFQGRPTDTIINFNSASTSSSLSMSWSDPSNVCGEITGYSVHIDSNKVMKCTLCVISTAFLDF